ncbi:MAG: hypothetical protein M3P96_05465 [Actinomycetota bacterium]|nr:hypothetical protein [Actinomycetota bacterium]
MIEARGGRPGWATDGEDTAWLPPPRWRALRCAVRGHRWTSQPTARGIVLVLCARCSEIVTARFVDVADVLGAVPSTDLRSAWLGGATAARSALDLVAALLEDTDPAALRAQATVRPGAGVDALARLASVLAQLAAHGAQVDPQHVVRQVGLQVEMQLLDAELGAEGTG